MTINATDGLVELYMRREAAKTEIILTAKEMAEYKACANKQVYLDRICARKMTVFSAGGFTTMQRQEVPDLGTISAPHTTGTVSLESYDSEKAQSMAHWDIPLEGPLGWRARFRRFDRKPWETEV